MTLKKLSVKDKRIFDKFLSLRRHSLSSYAFVNIYIWKSLFGVYWGIINGALSVFFEDNGAYFMYLPPLADNLTPPTIEKSFAVMDGFNKNKGYSRIENVEEKDLAFYKKSGYECNKKNCDYLCRRADLAAIRGNAFKAKRAARNYFLKHYDFEYLPFAVKYKEACLDLYDEWAKSRQAGNEDSIYRGMLKDNLAAMKILLDDYEHLGVSGRIALIGGELKAFTFGFPINEDIFCVLYEITDLRVKGLSQFIFQKFSSELKDYKRINIMDDSGLDNLKKVKLSYHPSDLAASYTIKSG